MSYWIGPVELVDLFEPSLTFTGTPTALGLQPGQITGQTEWWQAHQLKELVNNPHRRVTIGGQSGVLEPIYFSDPMLGPLTSWCLLQSFQLGQADQSHSLQGTTGLVPYTLGLQSLGDRDFVLTHSARAKGNVFGLTAQSLAVSPVRPESDSGDRFIDDPGGTFGTRAYDPSHPYDPAVPAPSPANIGFYSSTVTGLANVCFPRLAWTKDLPEWISQQGGRVRAFDRREQREVYGPHTFLESTDLGIDNGLVRFWAGNRGLVPFLNVQAFDGTTWREVGTLQLGISSTLRRARLTRITAENAVVALTVDGYGDAFVTVKRGERLLRIDLPDANLRPKWRGMPPGHASSAVNGTGKFGNGLGAGHGGADWDDAVATWDDLTENWDGASAFAQPDVRLSWPPEQSQNEWAFAFWLSPYESAVGEGDAGYLTVYDANGLAAVQLFLDRTDQKIKLRIGATTLASAAQSFSPGDNLFVAARFSTTAGMTLSVRSPAGVTAHYSNPATDRGTTGLYDEFVFYGIQEVTGDLYPADDLYPANDLYPGSLVWGDGSLPGFTQYADGVVDNVMIFADRLTDAEVVSLGAAGEPLANLPDPWARLVWYAPFDCLPLPTFTTESGGRTVANVTENGLTKVVAFLDTAHISAGAYLVTGHSLDTVADVHAQLAAENGQETRVR